MASTISAGTSSGTALNMAGDTSGSLALQTNNGTTAVTIDTSQNVGIGTASPSAKLQVNSTNSTVGNFWGNNGNNYIQISDNNGTNNCSVGSISGGNFYAYTAGYSIFYTGGANERMRIDSSGRVFYTGTTAINYAHFGSTWGSSGAWGWGPQSTGGSWIVQNASAVGVYLGYGNNSWSAGSDERIKDIIEPITNAIEKISTLRSVIGKYKTDEEGKRRAFLIAQDVQKILPEAVDVQDDEEKTLGLRYQDLIPLLVASVKELNAKVDAQAAEIKALKGVA